MANPRYNKQVAQKRGGGGWKTGSMPYTYPSSKGGVAVGDYDQHNSENRAGSYDKKVGKVMHEYKAGKLRSGSKTGPKVKSRKQAIAIGMSEARKAAAGY